MSPLLPALLKRSASLAKCSELLQGDGSQVNGLRRLVCEGVMFYVYCVILSPAVLLLCSEWHVARQMYLRWGCQRRELTQHLSFNHSKNQWRLHIPSKRSFERSYELRHSPSQWVLNILQQKGCNYLTVRWLCLFVGGYVSSYMHSFIAAPDFTKRACACRADGEKPQKHMNQKLTSAKNQVVRKSHA
jgi:hypothetical protein